MELRTGWELASTPPGACASPAGLAPAEWVHASVPGTAAGAIGDLGRDYDGEDWWFRCRFETSAPVRGERLMLELDGVATVSQVFLDGRLVGECDSMWRHQVVDVTDLITGRHELHIVCRALGPLLARRRPPAPRWRTRVVEPGNLRWFRTMMFGRSPGFAPGPAAVGPWRPVRLARRPPDRLDQLALGTRLDGEDGIVTLNGAVAGRLEEIQVAVGDHRVAVRPGPDGSFAATLRVPAIRPWWPHTHGEPVLYDCVISAGAAELHRRRVGFRGLSFAPDIPHSGPELQVNGVPVFARGAVWTPADLISLSPGAQTLRRLIERARQAGMNMLRVVGTGAYESPQFHDLCDELGVLVWQDLMFANLDYPVEDPAFRSQVEGEVRQLAGELRGRPSLAVVCGNSEVEQQPAMLGLDPRLGRSDLWEQIIPRWLAEAGLDCAYVRSTPCGGDLPFHPDRGLTHYFGVSGYFAPLAAARQAGVRFASECLAFANVPDQVTAPVHHPRWKQGVQRDAGTGWDLGAGWDFDDVRDHYLELLFGADPVQLRRYDHDRYLQLSRAATGEVMAEVIGDWRALDSRCQGALVLWFKDMLPGAGLGVLDSQGHPKVAYHHLRRAMAPLAVWTTDDQLAGVGIHVANDGGEPLRARLRLALYRDSVGVGEAEQEIELPPHGHLRRSVEGMLGRFVDSAWAYRFGPPAQDAIVVSLESLGASLSLLAQAFRFPAGRPSARESADRLGLAARRQSADDGSPQVSVSAARLVYGVQLHAPGWLPEDSGFSIEPGHARTIRLVPDEPGHDATAPPASVSLTALNLDSPLLIAMAASG